ncbi:hypothetical protein SDC9_199224 [bioreactor metagenome]|uniref:Uncharacterized protein n=1 Tax=bioreactor metagenome TaxID=1076179 RepID=A0A645IKM6_9ZZZZ
MTPKNKAPIKITRLIKNLSLFSVEIPGRIPGIKPPDLRNSSAISLGLKTTEV